METQECASNKAHGAELLAESTAVQSDHLWKAEGTLVLAWIPAFGACWLALPVAAEYFLAAPGTIMLLRLQQTLGAALPLAAEQPL